MVIKEVKGYVRQIKLSQPSLVPEYTQKVNIIKIHYYMLVMLS
jgi:hypothetical protein